VPIPSYRAGQQRNLPLTGTVSGKKGFLGYSDLMAISKSFKS
jgi:hypothetical protein